jgi:hypothetical protein
VVNVTREDVRKLQRDPLSFAILMDERHIEQVIVVFVSVLNKRKSTRGDQH